MQRKAISIVYFKRNKPKKKIETFQQLNKVIANFFTMFDFLFVLFSHTKHRNLKINKNILESEEIYI